MRTHMLSILFIGSLEMALGDQCTAKMDSHCNLLNLDFCTRHSEVNNWTDLSICLLQNNPIDNIIDCMGKKKKALCVSTKGSDKLQDLDDNEDGCWCISPRGILLRAASLTHCNVFTAFSECPDDDGDGFRSCLCNRSVRSCHIDCLVGNLELTDEVCDFTDQCLNPGSCKEPKPRRIVSCPRPHKQTSTLQVLATLPPIAHRTQTPPWATAEASRPFVYRPQKSPFRLD